METFACKEKELHVVNSTSLELKERGGGGYLVQTGKDCVPSVFCDNHLGSNSVKLLPEG